MDGDVDRRFRGRLARENRVHPVGDVVRRFELELREAAGERLQGDGDRMRVLLGHFAWGGTAVPHEVPGADGYEDDLSDVGRAAGDREPLPPRDPQGRDTEGVDAHRNRKQAVWLSICPVRREDHGNLGMRWDAGSLGGIKDEALSLALRPARIPPFEGGRDPWIPENPIQHESPCPGGRNAFSGEIACVGLQGDGSPVRFPHLGHESIREGPSDDGTPAVRGHGDRDWWCDPHGRLQPVAHLWVVRHVEEHTPPGRHGTQGPAQSPVIRDHGDDIRSCKGAAWHLGGGTPDDGDAKAFRDP